MNRYQRFAGGSLKFDGLGRLPVSRGEFLGLAVCNDGVDVLEAAMHPVDLEFHAKFSQTVAL